MMSDDFDNDSGFAHALDPQKRANRNKWLKEGNACFSIGQLKYESIRMMNSATR